MDGTWFRSLLALFFLLPALPAHAANSRGDDPDMMGYDTIVNQLNREADRPILRAKQQAQANTDAFDTIWFHGGVGLSTMMESLDLEDGSNLFVDQKGVQISGGIDLFSPNWLAEGTMRNFGETENSPTHVSLKEFELKIIFHDQFARRMGFHAGGGLSARYMSVRRVRTPDADYVTPSSVVSLGYDYFLAEHLTLGIEAAARTSMVTDTVDRGSYDATIRLDLQL